MKLGTAAILMLLFSDAKADDSAIALPLNAPASLSGALPFSLTLRVSGDPDWFEVEVTSGLPTKKCARNLIAYELHGPDEYQIAPWHIAKNFYPNVRTIPVCGYPLSVRIELRDPLTEGEGDNERFVGGWLLITASRPNR